MKQCVIGIHKNATYRFTVSENKKVYRKIYEALCKSAIVNSATKGRRVHKNGYVSVRDIIETLRRREPWKTRIDKGQSLLAWEKNFYRSFWGRKWLALKAFLVSSSK